MFCFGAQQHADTIKYFDGCPNWRQVLPVTILLNHCSLRCVQHRCYKLIMYAYVARACLGKSAGISLRLSRACLGKPSVSLTQTNRAVFFAVFLNKPRRLPKKPR